MLNDLFFLHFDHGIWLVTAIEIQNTMWHNNTNYFDAKGVNTAMMVSTKGRYALRVMIDLAEHDDGLYIPLKEIAARQDISEKYLESIVKLLTRNGDLVGVRGKGGGYRLTRSPEEYTVGGILRLTEGSLAPVGCPGLESRSCSRAEECRTLPMWQKLDQLINSYLESITLADLACPDGEGPGA